MHFNKPNKILIIAKKSRYELEVGNQEQEQEQAFYNKTKILNNSLTRIMSSHQRQLQSRKILQNSAFLYSEIIFRAKIAQKNLSDYDLIIALGGDNHFTFIGHHCITHNIPILGCNSDTRTSLGALLYFSPESLVAEANNKWQNLYCEQWPLLFAQINYPDGQIVETIGAISEISVRNNNPDLISRYIISYRGTIEEQKSSGVLLVTGAGSTGWYQSGHYNQEIDKSFDKQADFFQIYCRELSKTARKKYRFTDFSVHDQCTIISDMDGGISIDCLPERVYPFPSGTIARFQFMPKKLAVVTPAK